jgi:hypothetical protein
MTKFNPKGRTGVDLRFSINRRCSQIQYSIEFAFVRNNNRKQKNDFPKNFFVTGFPSNRKRAREITVMIEDAPTS